MAKCANQSSPFSCRLDPAVPCPQHSPAVRHSLVQAYYHTSSKWSVWEEDADISAEHQQRLAANHVSGWAPPLCADYLAASTHPEQPFATLRQVLLETPNREPQYYRVLVRVVDYLPQESARLTHPAVECGLADAGYPHPCTYTIQLLLEDATGQVDGLLFGTQADIFFNEEPAPDVRQDQAGREALLAKLNKLLGLGCER